MTSAAQKFLNTLLPLGNVLAPDSGTVSALSELGALSLQGTQATL